MKLTLLITSLFLVSITSALATDSSAPAANFLKVDPGIFRGARPSAAGGVQMLDKMGIKTIIDLEDIPAVVAKEKQAAESAGIRFISYPIVTKATPNSKEVDSILAALHDNSNQPVYVHCMHGEDRTGLIIGLYRTKFDGWSSDKAYAEMIQNHFHPIYKELDQYFKSQK